VPTIITFTPLTTPQRMNVSGKGRSLIHECRDANGKEYRQRLPLGSVRGIFFLDALCLHCGAHFVWVEDGEAAPPVEDVPRVKKDPA
jgi:hypothetical protein